MKKLILALTVACIMFPTISTATPKVFQVPGTNAAAVLHEDMPGIEKEVEKVAVASGQVYAFMCVIYKGDEQIPYTFGITTVKGSYDAKTAAKFVAYGVQSLMQGDKVVIMDSDWNIIP